ncbi:hypothetical protein EYR36_005165 [Pleurotus pulmonarius]|nr:hypothetical protein EYR36_005165 [Pleurotus pulmonarius]
MMAVVSTGNPAVAKPFAIMQLVGGMLLFITLVTAVFAKDVKRNFSWISFCTAGILSCVAYDLLFFAGQQTGPPPDPGLCLVQGALVHAVPVMQAGVNLALIAHFAIQHPQTVERDNTGVYCKIVFDGIPSKITAGISAVLIAPNIKLNIWDTGRPDTCVDVLEAT